MNNLIKHMIKHIIKHFTKHITGKHQLHGIQHFYTPALAQLGKYMFTIRSRNPYIKK